MPYTDHIKAKQTEARQMTTYYESAQGITITHKRAIKELREHGVTDLKEFYDDLGKQETYQAQAVLAWLGY